VAKDTETIVLFDGVCNMCNGFVKFIVKRDPHARFKFAALQSEAGQRLLAEAGLPAALMDTVVLIERSSEPRTRAYVKSNAAVRVARTLGWPWALFYAFVAVPRPLRDVAYSFVARNRYRWFGKQEVCMIPTPDLKRRFLE